MVHMRLKTFGVAGAGVAAAGVLLMAAEVDQSSPERRPASSGDLSLGDAIKSLSVADEVTSGYKRVRFRHWVDTDSDGCTTRQEVLISEAVDVPSVGSRCRLSGGSWYSYYDAAKWTNPDDLDIDHLVPLKESWRSGADQWDAKRRQAYANDLGADASLVAVTDNVNQAKGDKDPANWLPSHEVCRYASEWVSTKLRWKLSADTAEINALETVSDNCDTRVEFEPAPAA